jgi:serine/threonine-protein kinase RsbT
VQPDTETLLPIVRRVVGARVSEPQVAEDLVQETLARVLAAAPRIQPAMYEPYAITTARNLVASMWKEKDRDRRNRHRIVDLTAQATPDEAVLADEDRAAVSRALARLPDRDRELLLAHEVSGRDTRSIAHEVGSTPGAVAAQLNRTRSRLRVEYLLALEEAAGPPSGDCRPVLFAVSGGDRRRQREIDVERHLLDCDFCARLSVPLFGRSRRQDGQRRIAVRTDADIVTARQTVRGMATELGFARTGSTLIATAVSEVARNIVRFAGAGEICVEPTRIAPGLCVIARDSGPGIKDVEQAMTDGFSTCRGLGLGLAGARRLMDEFEVVSEPGRGTTVTMTKWLGKAK